MDYSKLSERQIQPRSQADKDFDAAIQKLLEQGEADRRRLDLLESMRPCTLQMWVGQTAIHKPGEFFRVNEYGKTIRQILDGIAAAPASKETAK